MQANQLRLWFASFSHVLMNAPRRIGLSGTRLAAATCGTIRLKLLKIGALVKISVRRVLFSMASAFPYVDCYASAWAGLSKAVCKPLGTPETSKSHDNQTANEHPAPGRMKRRVPLRARTL